MEKELYIEELKKLDNEILKRLIELSKNKKAIDYLTNPILFGVLKAFLMKK